MALFSIDFYSTILGHETDLTVIVPEEKDISDFSKKTEPYDTVYLLHGMGDNGSAWSRLSNIEHYANETGFLLVMPSAGHSFYTNAVYEKAWGTFFENELPYHVGKWFNLSDNKFIAGLSMGRFGAFKIGFKNLKQFKGIAGLSSVLSLVELKNNAPSELKSTINQVYKVIWGTENPNTSIHQLVKDIDAYCKYNNGPIILHYCGLNDFLYGDNKRFMTEMKETRANYHFEEWEGGHEWGFWDEAIKKTLILFREEVKNGKG